MFYYMTQIRYTAVSWNALIRTPQDRPQVVRELVESLGGKLESVFMCFGDYDALAIFQLPDNISASAISMALMAPGAFLKVKTTPLLTWAEGMEAMKMAKKAVYRPPEESPMLKREP